MKRIKSNHIITTGKELCGYVYFEDGKIDLSESNIEIITRLLCIEEGNSFLLDDYISIICYYLNKNLKTFFPITWFEMV